jgi:transcription-repair coupling factor (superfamily II helicase)
VPPRSRNLVLEAVASCPSFQRIRERFPGPTERLTVGGARGSVGAALFAAIHRAFPDRILVAVAPDSSTASSIEADLDALLGEGDARLYPQRETLTSETDEPNLEIGGMRVEAIEGLFSGQARAVVTTLRALQERAPVPTNLAELRITLRVGDRLGMKSLIQSLEERGFERVPVVEEVGQIAVRGGLVDIFSFGSSDPLRVEFWGDEIESLRAFDILDQRSTGKRSVGHGLPVDFRPVESDSLGSHPLPAFRGRMGGGGREDMGPCQGDPSGAHRPRLGSQGSGGTLPRARKGDIAPGQFPENRSDIS